MGVDETNYTIAFDLPYYGGTLDVASGTLTVKVIKSTFINPYTVISTYTDETYICFQRAFSSEYYHGSNNDSNLACNMFAVGASLSGERLLIRGGAGSGSVALVILKSRLDVSSAVDPQNPTQAEWIAAYNTWATTNVVEFTYTLNTPQTVSISPLQIYSLSQVDEYTPRLNTVYSDQISVQVGYPKSPQATQNELTSAIVSLGGNV